MSRRARRSKVTEPQTSPVHWRDPNGDNERSACGAENDAQFVGETVVCSTDIREVGCPKCHSVVDVTETKLVLK